MGRFDVAREFDGPTARHASAVASSTHALNLVFAIAAQRSKPRSRNERRYCFGLAAFEPVTLKMDWARIIEESGFGPPGRERDRRNGRPPGGTLRSEGSSLREYELSKPQRIYIVDDDVEICRTLERYLPEWGFEVQSASDGSDLQGALATFRPDLIVLDLGLPGDDGFTLAREIRATSEVPIIMLTGRSGEVDRIVGLELGADDYVTKPFSPREFLARINAVLRRTRRADRAGHTPVDAINAAAVTFAGWEFDLVDRRLVSPSGVEVKLTKSEFNFLAAFVAAPNRVLSRGELLSLSRKYGDEVLERSIDIQIFRLRQKIEESGEDVQLIKTQRGAGYIFTPEVKPIR